MDLHAQHVLRDSLLKTSEIAHSALDDNCVNTKISIDRVANDGKLTYRDYTCGRRQAEVLPASHKQTKKQ